MLLILKRKDKHMQMFVFCPEARKVEVQLLEIWSHKDSSTDWSWWGTESGVYVECLERNGASAYLTYSFFFFYEEFGFLISTGDVCWFLIKNIKKPK